jgi:hypothetical protein
MIHVIIPYRQRKNQLHALLQKLRTYPEVNGIVVCEQSDDNRPFNRGWCKNAGFVLCASQPDDTVYFYDVDLLPGPAFFGFPKVEQGEIRHLYGHHHCLGGIVGFCAMDFIHINGFCNDLWAWGGEDRLLTEEAKAHGLKINRSLFLFRFSYNKIIGEMDEQGHVMDDALAKQLFLRDIRDKKKVVPDLSVIASRSALNHTPVQVLSNVEEGIINHFIVSF